MAARTRRKQLATALAWLAAVLATPALSAHRGLGDSAAITLPSEIDWP